MDLFQLKLFQRMSERMGWLGARQEVLAQNIANADTPGYRARDIEDFGTVVEEGSLAFQRRQTRPGHLD